MKRTFVDQKHVIVKGAALPRLMRKCSVLQKPPSSLPSGCRQANSNIYMGMQAIQKIHNNLEKKIEVGGFTFLHFKTYNKVVLTKAVQCWHKDRHTDLMNRIESTEINPCAYSPLIFQPGFQQEKVLLTDGIGTRFTGQPHVKQMSLGPSPTTCKEYQLKMDQRPKCESKMIKLLQKSQRLIFMIWYLAMDSQTWY